MVQHGRMRGEHVNYRLLYLYGDILDELVNLLDSLGASFDSWEAGLLNSGSAPAKLKVRFEGCTTNIARRGYTLN